MDGKNTNKYTYLLNFHISVWIWPNHIVSLIFLILFTFVYKVAWVWTQIVPIFKIKTTNRRLQAKDFLKDLSKSDAPITMRMDEETGVEGEKIKAFKRFNFLSWNPLDSSVILEKIEKKKIVRTEEEIKKMSTKQYLDELVVPVLNKAMLLANKEVNSKRIFIKDTPIFNQKYLWKASEYFLNKSLCRETFE